jgi:hypothetical protein
LHRFGKFIAGDDSEWAMTRLAPLFGLGLLLVTSVSASAQQSGGGGSGMTTSASNATSAAQQAIAAANGQGLPVNIPVVTLNSTGAATANRTAINAALASGGFVGIYGNGTVWIDQHLLVTSNDDLYIGAGTTIEQVNSTNDYLITNTGANVALQTNVVLTWSSGTQASVAWTGHGRSVGQRVTLIGTANGATSTVAGSVVPVAGGSNYTVGCTVPIAGGTVNNNTFLNGGAAVLTVDTLSGSAIATAHVSTSGNYGATPAANQASGTSSCGGTGATWNLTFGYTDPAFFGVYTVISVTDANDFVVELESIPAVAPVGQVIASVADTNITIEGPGALDYNYANNQVAGKYSSIFILGADNVQVLGLHGIDSWSQVVSLQQVRNFLIDGFNSDTTQSDIVHIHGAAYHGRISRIGGFASPGNGDAVALEPQYFTTAAHENSGGGSIMDVEVSQISVTTAGSGNCVPLYAHSIFQIDNIRVNEPDCATTGTGPEVVFNSQTGLNGLVGRVMVSNVRRRLDATNNLVLVNNPTAVDDLDISGISGPQAKPATSSILDVSVNSTAVVKKLAIHAARFPFLGASEIAFVVLGTVNSASVDTSYFAETSASAPIALEIGGSSTVGQFTARDNYFGSGITPVKLTSGVSSNPTINFISNYITTTLGVECDNSCVTVSSGNHFTGASVGAVKFSGTGTNTLKGTGDQIDSGNCINFSGTPTVYVYNQTCSVDVTKLARNATAGQIVNNTNATAGGGTALTGIMVDDGTNASGSWHLLSSPTLKTY